MSTVILLYCTDVRDGYNNTPLLSACMGGNKELVQYLVEEVKCDVGEFVGGYIDHYMYVLT